MRHLAFVRLMAIVTILAAMYAWYDQTYGRIDYEAEVWRHNRSSDEEYRQYKYVKEFRFGTCYANEDGWLLHGRFLGFTEMSALDLCVQDFKKHGKKELSQDPS